uniref:Uncharacterized protein n=1 Tax=Macaca fascicularis TaxID=9541 RepID=A0A7N9D0N7_MACFA
MPNTKPSLSPGPSDIIQVIGCKHRSCLCETEAGFPASKLLAAKCQKCAPSCKTPAPSELLFSTLGNCFPLTASSLSFPWEHGSTDTELNRSSTLGGPGGQIT